MLEKINLENVLFLDIETVPMAPDYNNCIEPFKSLWDKKCINIKSKQEQTPEELFPKAGIYAEFGKIICICTALIKNSEIHVNTFADRSEQQLLSDFTAFLNSNFTKEYHLLCAHNGKEFDFPYISRRILINGLKLPAILNIAGLKPWQIRHLDTMELWKFGDYKNYTSLEVLAAAFGLIMPKDDISGSDVAKVYWQDNNLERIITYCQKDVITVCNLFCKYKGVKIEILNNIIYI